MFGERNTIIRKLKPRSQEDRERRW